MLNDTLQYADFKALSPLLLLLLASLAFLLIESFAEKMAKRLVFPLAIGTLLISLVIAYDFPMSSNPLLTPWISFDATARQFTLLFLGIGLASTLLSYSFFKRNDSSQGEYLFFLFSCIFGLLLIGMSVDFLTLFLGIETLSIATYILCGYMKKWKISHEAALKYFLMGALAAAFLLYGIALIYGATGTTNFKELLVKYQQMNNSSDQALFLAGVALVNLGLAFKAALVPFHLWAPDVYEGSPTSVVAFMAVGTKAGAFAAFTRVFLMALPHFDPLFTKLLLGIAYMTLIYANLVAIQQFQLRRVFAYSGIAQAGFLLIPFIIGTNEALSALMFYLVVYTIATL